MNKYVNGFFMTPLVVLCIGCSMYSEITVTTEKTSDFSRYRTFAWLQDQVDTANSPYNNEIIRNNIRNYFGKSFSERGYVLNIDTPDVLLQVVVSAKKKEREVRYFPHPRPYYFHRYYLGSDYYYPYPPNYYYSQYQVYCYPLGYCVEKIEYVEGAITLNVIDRKANKQIWSGTAKGDIYDPAFINRNIHPAVEAIMKKFPTKPVDYNKKAASSDDVYPMSNSVLE